MDNIFLAMEIGGGYRHAGRNYTSDEAAGLIAGKEFAAITRDGGLAASDDRAWVARQGTPGSGASLAAALSR